MFSPIVFLKKVSRLDYTINSHENCCAGTIELILIVFHILKNYGGIHLTSVHTICRLLNYERLPQNYYGI